MCTKLDLMDRGTDANDILFGRGFNPQTFFDCIVLKSLAICSLKDS